jgi:hypothetical protein
MESAGRGGRAADSEGARGATGGVRRGDVSNGGARPAAGRAGDSAGRAAGGSPGTSRTTSPEAGDTGESGNAGGGGEPSVTLPTLPPGIFDPKQVYLWGTVAPGECQADALAPWWAPNSAQTGFSCRNTTEGIAAPELGVGIDPKSERLIYFITYFSGAKLFAFVADGDGSAVIPQMPQNNDIPIETVCDWPTALLLDPQGKGVVYRCESGGGDVGVPVIATYYWDSGEELAIATGYTPLHLGYRGTILVTNDAGDGAVQSPAGDITPLSDSLKGLRGAVTRSHPMGFWVLRQTDASRAPERWNVGLDGTVTLDGNYPADASDDLGGNCAFEAGGALLCIVDGGGSNDEIVRSELGEEKASVVYSENTDPLVQIHISQLFTGP